jgi:ABC-type protease/lipase transport system fused ATPase/permease subunit
MLTGSLFMLEVYDRVLPSRSVSTLIGLSILTATLFGFQALLEITRGRLLVRIGNHLDYSLSTRLYELIIQTPLRSKAGTDATLPVRDLDTVRSFCSGTGPTALFDMPWVPFYIAICFAFHPMIGLAALCGALILVGRVAQPLGRDRQAQCRSADRDGHVRSPARSLEEDEFRLSRRAEARQ